MRVTVLWDLCEGNGVCASAAPAVFEMDDDDQLVVLQHEPGEGLRPSVEAAARVCPKRALLIGD